VADAASPTQRSKLVFSNSNSEAEYNHLAFLHWEPTGLVVVPMSTYGVDPGTGGEDAWVGAVAVTLADGQLSETGRIAHPEVSEGGGESGAPDYRWRPWIQRSFVAGGSVFTVSESGVQANDLSSLEVRGWQPWSGSR
jgi:hypothetical protein